MSVGLGIIVFFVSLIALVAEVILYFIFGFGALLANNLSGVAFFFVGLMLATSVVGIFYPICCIIAKISKND